MLLTMKALTQAARGLVYMTAATLDVAQLAPDEATRTAASNRASLLTPVVKAWISDTGAEVASLGVQVHGGTGYVDDAEISQIFRDSRIGSIFEGTNYIQAQDLLGRKIVRERGATLNALLHDIDAAVRALPADDAKLAGLRSQMLEGSSRLREAAARIIRDAPSDPELIGAVAYHFLLWVGVLIGGWQWTLLAAGALAGKLDASSASTLDTAAFYAAHILPRMRLHEALVSDGSSTVAGVPPASI
jgi:hypothetical protein